MFEYELTSEDLQAAEEFYMELFGSANEEELISDLHDEILKLVETNNGELLAHCDEVVGYDAIYLVNTGKIIYPEEFKAHGIHSEAY